MEIGQYSMGSTITHPIGEGSQCSLVLNCNLPPIEKPCTVQIGCHSLDVHHVDLGSIY